MQSRNGTTGSIEFGLEEFPYWGELISLELEVHYTISKYHPAVMYLRNGDPGYPAEGGDVDFTAQVKGMTDGEGRPVGTSPGDREPYQDAFDHWIEDHPDVIEKIEERCREDADGREGDYDDRDD